MSSILIRRVHQHSILLRHYPVAVNKLIKFSSEDKKNPLIKDTEVHKKYSRENVRDYFFQRFFDYIQNYDKVLQKNFPKTFNLYTITLNGVKAFYSDMKRFFKINGIVNNKGIKALTRKEIELYMQTPKDIAKVAPVLIIAAFPFANYVIFPLAFMYPRKLLCSHFWTLQQKVEFQELYLKERTSYNKKIFRKLQENLDATKRSQYHKEFNYALGLLGSGTHPNVDEIIAIKDIFMHAPYKLDSLKSSHLTYLCKLHGIHSLYLKRVRLSEHCYTMHNMDLAIRNEGGEHNLPIEALRLSCYLRGMNPVNLQNEEMIKFLRAWLQVSLDIGTDYNSLYLHLPILLTYNHPNNWRLTHK